MVSFKAKARAVDLLGKGQIADLPTAISELWKNGYDAYADSVFAALYMADCAPDVKTHILVIGDDGLGMSKTDIIDKWLVLGTDNKAAQQLTKQKDTRGKSTLNKQARVKMGEKGIGRLSVAYLGSPMLMLTKQQDNQVQALYLDWRIFELYDLYLEDVALPVYTIAQESELSETFRKMKDEFIAPLGEHQYTQDFSGIFAAQLKKMSGTQDDIKNSILTSTLNANIPQNVAAEHIQKIFAPDAHGTIFIIFEAIPQLVSMYQSNGGSAEIEAQQNELRGALGAFYNPFVNYTSAPPISTSFLVIDSKGNTSDRLATKELLSFDDFAHADHLIEGTFDEYGNFEGDVRVYNEWFRGHKYISKKNPTTRTSYGKVQIKLGYIPGEFSLLSKTEYEKYNTLLNIFGGLHVYRDGFRVLPYGKTDSDFLDFEQRRSKFMGQNFFSHRRMFGFLAISKEDNPELIDKAGREGFIKNAAYRDFRDGMIAFFKHLSSHFFGTLAKDPTKNAVLDALRARKQAEKQAAETEKLERQLEQNLRKEYTKQLDEYNTKLATLESSLRDIETELDLKNKEANVAYDDIAKLVAKWNTRKAELNMLTPPQAIRFTLTEKHKKSLQSYTRYWETIKLSLATQRDSLAVAEARLKEHEQLQSYQRQYKQFYNILSNLSNDYAQEVPRIEQRIKSIIRSHQEASLKELSDAYTQYTPHKVTEVKPAIDALREKFEMLQQNFTSTIPPFIAQFKNLDLSINLDASVAYYKQIAQEAQDFKELVLLGLAVEIIDHEFNTLYAQMEYVAKKLETSEKSTPQKERLLSYIKQLSETYASVTPLYRSAGRFPVELSGAEMTTYLNKFFGEKLKLTNTSIQATESFANYIFKRYDSHFRAVYINIINNAIFWLRNQQDKKIVLDFVDNKLLLLNSGEPIEDYNLEIIFNMFVSFRPNGRGLGLFISRQLLNKDGFELYATNDKTYNYLGGACFIIEPTSHYDTLD